MIKNSFHLLLFLCPQNQKGMRVHGYANDDNDDDDTYLSQVK